MPPITSSAQRLGTTYSQSDYDVARPLRPNGWHGSGAGVNAAIPEPATLMLLMFAAVGRCLYQRRTT